MRSWFSVISVIRFCNSINGFSCHYNCYKSASNFFCTECKLSRLTCSSEKLCVYFLYITLHYIDYKFIHSIWMVLKICRIYLLFRGSKPYFVFHCENYILCNLLYWLNKLMNWKYRNAATDAKYSTYWFIMSIITVIAAMVSLPLRLLQKFYFVIYSLQDFITCALWIVS